MRTKSLALFTGGGIPGPLFTAGIGPNLILQEGVTQDRDPEWGVDTFTVPYLIKRNALDALIIPNQWASHPTISTLQFWQPRITNGKVMAEVSYIWRGIVDGIAPPIDRNLGLAPVDTTQLQTLQISDPNSNAVVDVAFYCPQTTWRWITLGYPQTLPTAYATINDPFNQKVPVPIRYFIRVDPGGAPSDLTGIIRTEATTFRTERWGPYQKNEITVSKRYTNPFAA